MVIFSLLAAGCASTSRLEQRTAHLRILHWNDFHAHNIPYEVSDSSDGRRTTYRVGGSGNLLGYLKHFGKGDDEVATFNAGDDVQGTPISGLTSGRSQIELMNIINPDAMVVGNHEFDYGLTNFRQNIRLATYSIVGANLYDSAAGATFVPPVAIKTFGKVKVGIIGLLPSDLPILTMRQNLVGTSMLDVDSIVSFHAARLRDVDHVDLVIAISHMGLGPDTMLAMRHPDVDMIVGGHSHIPLFKPIKKNRTVIVQAGSWGRYVGKLDLVVDLQGDSLLNYSGELIETKLGIYSVDSIAEQKAATLEKLVDKELNEEIGTLTVEWRRSFWSESNIGNWATDVLRQFAGSDIAFVNSGSLRKNLSPGIMRKRDVWDMFPFNNTFVSFSVIGDTLMKMLEWQADRKGEFMQMSGLRYSYDPDKPFGSKVVNASVNGNPVEPNKYYTIATNSYVGGHIPEHLGVQLSSLKLKDLDAIDRNVYIEFIQRTRMTAAQLEGRVVNIKSPEPKYDKVD